MRTRCWAASMAGAVLGFDVVPIKAHCRACLSSRFAISLLQICIPRQGCVLHWFRRQMHVYLGQCNGLRRTGADHVMTRICCTLMQCIAISLSSRGQKLFAGPVRGCLGCAVLAVRASLSSVSEFELLELSLSNSKSALSYAVEDLQQYKCIQCCVCQLPAGQGPPFPV